MSGRRPAVEIDREKRVAQRRLKAAKSPNRKTLDDLDFASQPSIDKLLVAKLMRGKYIDRCESVLRIGNPGTGKTHLATGLGVEACQQGRKVRFFRVTGRVTALIGARELLESDVRHGDKGRPVASRLAACPPGSSMA
jgi:DNA replication protein DnaC